MKKCYAQQFSDTMVCRCGNVWDTNDPYPPECKKQEGEAEGMTDISKRTAWWRFMNFLGYRRVFYLQSEVYQGGFPIFCWVYHPRIPKRDYTQLDWPFINSLIKTIKTRGMK